MFCLRYPAGPRILQKDKARLERILNRKHMKMPWAAERKARTLGLVLAWSHLNGLLPAAWRWNRKVSLRRGLVGGTPPWFHNQSRHKTGSYTPRSAPGSSGTFQESPSPIWAWTALSPVCKPQTLACCPALSLPGPAMSRPGCRGWTSERSVCQGGKGSSRTGRGSTREELTRTGRWGAAVTGRTTRSCCREGADRAVGSGRLTCGMKLSSHSLLLDRPPPQVQNRVLSLTSNPQSWILT